MKILNIEDKDFFKEYLVNSLYSTNTSICPSYEESFISSKNKKFYKSNKSLRINIISHLNNLNASKLSPSSPVKINDSTHNKNKESNNVWQYDNLKTIIKFPKIREFNLYYEIPFHGKNDFIFLLRGNLGKNDWALKTKKLRTYPRHLRNTLFYQNSIHLQEIHKQNFNNIYSLFLRIKKDGIYLYNNKKYRECLAEFNYAYGLFKWIEFKNKKFILSENINNNNFTILDSDIEEKIIISNNSNSNKGAEIQTACLIYILEMMAYCYIELRLYSHAIECLEECAILAKNNFPDVYLRCAQTRIYNKNSSDEALKVAEKNINKALDLVHIYNNKTQKNKIDISIYFKEKNKLNFIIKKRIEEKVKYIQSLLKINLNLVQNRNYSDDTLYVKINDINLQYKVLREIKNKYILAFKFFTDNNDYTQLNLTYKEYESFYDIYHKFKFFYKFNRNIIDKNILKNLNPKEKKILLDAGNKSLIEKNRMNICDYIFSNYNYNKELYKYAVSKIIEKEKYQNGDNAQLNEIKNENKNSKKKCFVIKSSICFILLIFLSIGLQILYLKSIRRSGFRSLYK